MTRNDIEERTLKTAEYIIATEATVRAAAKYIGASKSTVHKDLTERLKEINLDLYNEVSAILAKNRAERHIRGGMATKRKFERKA